MAAQIIAHAALLASLHEVAKGHDVIVCLYKIFEWPLKLDGVGAIGPSLF